MKKKISLLGLVLILVLAFTGCSRSTIEYNETELEQYADFIIGNFSAMSEEDFASFEDMSELQLDLMLLNAGVPVSGDNFLSMMDAWQAGIEECGEFVSVEPEYTFTTSNDGVTLTMNAQYTERDATIAFAFDDKMNMDNITISASYSTGEILQKAGLNTILGMGTVFVVLIFLCFVIWLLKFIPALEKMFRRKSAAENASGAQTVPAEPSGDRMQTGDDTEPENDTELVAVISAAIAAAEGTTADGFVVRTIKRRKSNKW